jgi:hypothetical protein
VLCTATDGSGNSASGSFAVHVAAPPITAAELDIAFNATTGALGYDELHGGTVNGLGTHTLTAAADGHTTLVQLGGAGDDGWWGGVSITRLTYDGAAPMRPGRNGYVVRIRHADGGGVRRIMLAAYANGDGVVVRFRSKPDQSTVWRFSHGRRTYVGTVSGLVVPHLSTSAGTVQVTLGS